MTAVKIRTAYKKIMTTLLLLINFFLTIIRTSLLTIFLCSCALFDVPENIPENIPAAKTTWSPTERQQILSEAATFYENNDIESAKTLYIKLSRYTDSAAGSAADPVYDQALWRLAKIYEKNNESEKAILILGELSTSKSNTLPKNKLRFALMKNYYLIENFTEARQVEKQIAEDYNRKVISLNELYQFLIEATDDQTYAARLPKELLGLVLYQGTIQKYFIYVMQSSLSPENETLTEQLIKNYGLFFTALEQKALSDEFKKKLSVSLYDQLNKFKQYKIDRKIYRTDSNLKTLSRFYDYCEKQQQLITESFYR